MLHIIVVSLFVLFLNVKIDSLEKYFIAICTSFQVQSP